MLYHYIDNDGMYLIGIYSVDKSHLKIKGLIEDNICHDLTKSYTDEYEDIGDFESDTVIIKPNQFDESMLDLAENGLSIFIVGHNNE